MQDLFNQHRVRPTLNTVNLLLDLTLRVNGGDAYEARRLVRIVQEMYSVVERETLSAHQHDDLLFASLAGEGGVVAGHLLPLGVPSGDRRAHAVLSHASLEKRFRKHGFSLS